MFTHPDVKDLDDLNLFVFTSVRKNNLGAGNHDKLWVHL